MGKKTVVKNEYSACGKKCAMKIMKKKKKRRACNINSIRRNDFILRYWRNSGTDFSELWAIDSQLNEGTNTLVIGRLG